ncbi:unnamed protein product [Amoebophrya sp. A25]|nr:unnamed protein product [Amoebophrya sp. A25]|eukprot:GSA25T00013943001.1
MCVKVVPEPTANYNLALEIGNFFFLLVFNVEFLLKLYAMRSAYFELGWNKFDFACVLASDIGFILQASGSELSSSAASSLLVLRTFRVARLFRLARFLKGLNKVFTAFVLSIPKLLNVGGLVALLLFFYTIIGMHLFARVREFGANVSIAQHNQYANFRTFAKAFLTLFRCVTGEGWNTLMHNYAADEFFYRSVLERECVDFMDMEKDYDWYESQNLIANPIECGSRWSYIFYISFVFVVFMVSLNLFIAVIFEAFDESASVGDEAFIEIAEICLNNWQKYDPQCSCYIRLGDAQQYIETMIQGLDVDPKFKTVARRQLMREPGSWTMAFAKSLYLRIDARGRVPVVACVLSILRFLIIHQQEESDGKTDDVDDIEMVEKTVKEEQTRHILAELEDMNEEFYRANTVLDWSRQAAAGTYRGVMRRLESSISLVGNAGQKGMNRISGVLRRSASSAAILEGVDDGETRGRLSASLPSSLDEAADSDQRGASFARRVSRSSSFDERGLRDAAGSPALVIDDDKNYNTTPAFIRPRTTTEILRKHLRKSAEDEGNAGSPSSSPSRGTAASRSPTGLGFRRLHFGSSPDLEAENQVTLVPLEQHVAVTKIQRFRRYLAKARRERPKNSKQRAAIRDGLHEVVLGPCDP